MIVVANLIDKLFPEGDLNEFIPFLNPQAKWFFTEGMNSFFQCVFDNGVVKTGGCSNDHEIQVFTVQHFRVVTVSPYLTELLKGTQNEG